jgi:hypothetical protein
MPQFAGGFQAGALLFRYGPYDDVILSDAPKAYWPAQQLDIVNADYDVLILSDTPKGYWPLDAKGTVTYDAYDTSVLGDTPKAYWPLDSIDTV